MKFCPDYGFTFERDRALWMYAVLMVFYALAQFYVCLNMGMFEDQITGDPSVAVNPAFVDLMVNLMLGLYLFMGVFYLGWAWVVLLPGKFAWWFTMVLQVMGVGVYLLVVLSSCFTLVMTMTVPGMMAQMKNAYRSSVLSVEANLYLNLGIMILLFLICLVITIWWWRRRRMYGIRFSS